MKAYLQLGTTGRSVFDVKEEIEKRIHKKIGMNTSDKPKHSCTTFEWEVKTPTEAKADIKKAFDYLTKQPWYMTEAVSFSTSGLTEDDNSEWYCPECGDDVNTCECKPEIVA